jgi:F-type H+-transporting ATPase subunit b
MIAELLSEVGHEIAARPTGFAIEVVQFGVFIGLVWFVAWGTRARRGMFAKALDARQERVAGELAEADEAEREADRMLAGLDALVGEAQEQAAARLKEARAAARKERAAILKAADAEGEQVMAQADESLERERADALAGVHDQLVELITESTRQIMDQSIPPARQRELIQEAVAAGVDDLERVSLS